MTATDFEFNHEPYDSGVEYQTTPDEVSISRTSSESVEDEGGIDLPDFPKSTTIEGIKHEYNALLRDTKTIIIFGTPPSLKCSIIDRILERNHSHYQSPQTVVALDPNPSVTIAPFQLPQPRRSVLPSNLIKKAMIRSQYELSNFAYHHDIGPSGTIVTEHTANDISHYAASNLRYFPVLKDEFPGQRMDLNRWNYRTEAAYKRDIERWWKRRYDTIYRKLSEFTPETLENTSYSMIRDYSLLCPAFIRQCQDVENMVIPLDITMLIDAYFTLDKPLMDLYRIQEPNGDTFNFGTTPFHPKSVKSWTHLAWDRCVDGIIFMVDLLWYNEYIVDEHGKRWNKLEHAISQWQEIRDSQFGIMILVNLEAFIRKTKVVPPTVCLLFSGINNIETINWTEWCLKRIYQRKLDIYDREVSAWYAGVVEEMGSENKGHKGEVKVHYSGYHPKYDEWLPVDSQFVAPIHLYSKEYGFEGKDYQYGQQWFKTINSMQGMRKLTWDMYLF